MIVTGPPGAGKSTLAPSLARELVLPLLAKDTIKEALMSVVPVDSVARSQLLGLASIRVLFALAAAQLDTGAGVVLEANFRTAEAAEDLAPLLARSRAVAIYCWVPMETVLERVRRRTEAGRRHPGHRDQDRMAMDLTLFDPSRYDPTELGIQTRRLEMTGDYDLDTVASWTRAALSQA